MASTGEPCVPKLRGVGRSEIFVSRLREETCEKEAALSQNVFLSLDWETGCGKSHSSS